jgi:hypothetical protein
MTKKWIAINLLLFVITGLLGWRLYLSILRFDVDNDLAKIQPVRDMKQKIVPEKVLPKLPPNKNYFPAEFAIVPEKNIFSESRSREEKAEVAAQPETPPLTQKPILVGINIADAQQTALIIDPTGSAQDRNHRAQTKRVGDVYRGFTITRIASDHIVLESGAQKEIVPLHEGSKKNQGGKTPILSTRVVSFGGGNASGGTPVVSSSGTAPSARRLHLARLRQRVHGRNRQRRRHRRRCRFKRSRNRVRDRVRRRRASSERRLAILSGPFGINISLTNSRIRSIGGIRGWEFRISQLGIPRKSGWIRQLVCLKIIGGWTERNDRAAVADASAQDLPYVLADIRITL